MTGVIRAERRQSRREEQVDDLVLAYNDLAEIIDARRSSFAYTSYRVRYLGKPPLPEMPEDWLPSEDNVKLVGKRNIREFYKRNLERFPSTEGALLVSLSEYWIQIAFENQSE